MSEAHQMTETHRDGARLAETRSAPALVGDLVSHVTELFRKEMMLLRAELNEKTTQLMTAVGMIAVGIVLAITALNVLAAAAVAAIESAGLAAGWAAVIVGAILGLVGFIMANSGMKKMKAANLAPRRTADSLSRDAAVVKEKVT